MLELPRQPIMIRSSDLFEGYSTITGLSTQCCRMIPNRIEGSRTGVVGVWDRHRWPLRPLSLGFSPTKYLGPQQQSSGSPGVLHCSHP